MGLASDFGSNVRATRQSKGLTIEALADEVGLAYSYVGQLERGLRNPTLSVVERVASVLQVSPLELLQPAGRDTEATKR